MTFTLPGGLRQDKRRCYSHSASITPQRRERATCPLRTTQTALRGSSTGAVTELEQVVDLDRQVGHPRPAARHQDAAPRVGRTFESRPGRLDERPGQACSKALVTVVRISRA